MTSAALLKSGRPLALDVVSVQSQVVYGRVGNNAAVPTLGSLGLSVAAVPTVVFSNIPSYPTMHGGALPPDWFAGYLSDLSSRGALRNVRALLAGYLGSSAQALILGKWIKSVLAQRSGVRVVIDPVMGDHEFGLYGADGMSEVYQQQLLPLADGITPNGFELSRLTGMPVESAAEVVAAAQTLLTGRTGWVAVTSAAPSSWPPSEMHVVLVTRSRALLITHPRVEATLAGTGDLFCAAMTGHWIKGMTLLESAIGACQQVVSALRHTVAAESAELLLPAKQSYVASERILAQELEYPALHPDP